MRTEQVGNRVFQRQTVRSQPLRRNVLLIAPPILFVSTYIAFQGFVALWGPQVGYLAGFLAYWVVWCLLFSVWILGREGLRAVFRNASQPLSRPAWLGALLLIWPPPLAAVTVLPAKFTQITLAVLLSSAALALVNATLEEVLWRGAYIRMFHDHKFWGWIYPSVGFRCGTWRHNLYTAIPCQAAWLLIWRGR